MHTIVCLSFWATFSLRGHTIVCQNCCMTILVVDDDPLVLDLVCEYLSLRFECKILRAQFLESAISLIWQHQIDLVISDYDLRKGNGLMIQEKLPLGTAFILFTGNAIIGKSIEISIPIVEKPNFEDLVRMVLKVAPEAKYAIRE